MSASYPYGYTMAATYDPAGLEPIRQDYPEVAAHRQSGYPYPEPYSQHQQPQPQGQRQPYDTLDFFPKPERVGTGNAGSVFSSSPAPPSSYGSRTVVSALSAPPRTATNTPRAPATSTTARSEKRDITSRTVFGCNLLVFILACIIALLSAAVIGLAAGVGIESSRANNVSKELAALKAAGAGAATTTTPGPTTPSPTSSLIPLVDESCDPNTTYTAFSQLGQIRFTRHCHSDTKGTKVWSLFTSNFDTCMDACAAYTRYQPQLVRNVTFAACSAVSFVPSWSVKPTASSVDAPGNCYLKVGPRNDSILAAEPVQLVVHAGVVAVA